MNTQQMGLRLIALSVGWLLTSAGEPTMGSVKQEPLGPVPANITKIIGTPAGCHVAIIAPDGKKAAFYIDGKEGPVFDNVYPYQEVFSPDGKRVACCGQRGSTDVAVVDGRQVAACDNIDFISFSPDSKRVAINAQKGEKWLANVDGWESPLYDTINNWIQFSADSNHFGYWVLLNKAGGARCIVVDGKPGPTYYSCNNGIRWSPVGARYAYFAYKPGAAVVVLDGSESPDGLDQLIFSPDGKHVAYVAGKKDPSAPLGVRYSVVLDGRPGAKYDFIGLGSLCFSADSEHLGYCGKNGNASFVVVDGKEGQPYESPGEMTSEPFPILSPRGGRVAYSLVLNNQDFIVVDGKTTPIRGSREQGPKFSPDGKRIVYTYRAQDNGVFAVVDGNEVDEFGGVGSIDFSPDSRHYAFDVIVATRRPANNPDKLEVDISRAAVIDGVQEPAYHDMIQMQGLNHYICFSPDSNSYAYAADTGKGQSMVLNGRPGPLYDTIVVDTFSFLPDGAVQYIAFKSGTIYRVTQSLAP